MKTFSVNFFFKIVERNLDYIIVKHVLVIRKAVTFLVKIIKYQNIGTKWYAARSDK